MLYSSTVSPVFSMLHESLQQVLAQRLAWQDLREVQERSYTAVISGKDTLVIAPTAGGKSEAALLPVMDDILKNGRTGVACLYIAPLKALINDQEERFSSFCFPTSLSVMKWHGDISRGDRRWREDDPPHILMITPESLEVLFQESALLIALRNVRFIIIDELHAFVETERGVHLKVLLGRLDALAQRKILRIGLSATTGNPQQVLRWLSDKRHGETLVEVAAEPKEKRFRFIVEPDFERRIDALVRIAAGKKALVFVNSRSNAEQIAQALDGRIDRLHIHHSSLSPAMRRAAEDAFASESGACIICTSTLELGIDIGDLDVVVQVDPPSSVASFLQRMGRSGRRGKAAQVAWILKSPFDLLCSCAIIECAMERETEHLRPLTRPYQVLVQQIFLLILLRKTATRRQIESALLGNPAFASVKRRELGEILSHLVREGYLTNDGDHLMPGDAAERIFGSSNWRDLYSVINGGGEYRAVTPEGDVIGNLDARFLRTSGEQGLPLGGRSWSVVKQDDEHNLVVVVPGDPGSSRIFWTGGGQGGYSPLICRRIQEIRTRGGTILPLTDMDKERIAQAFRDIPGIAAETGFSISETVANKTREIRISSYQGSQFNQVLSALIKAELGGQTTVRFDDLSVSVRLSGVPGSADKVRASLKRVQKLTRSAAGNRLPLPSQDQGKFTRLLPPPLFREMILSDYYHLEEFLETIRDLPVYADESAIRTEMS